MPATINTANTKGQSQSVRYSKDIKSHLNLFSQLYTSYTTTQIKKGELTAFFSHDTLKHSSSVSKYVKIWFGDKPNLLLCTGERKTLLFDLSSVGQIDVRV